MHYLIQQVEAGIGFIGEYLNIIFTGALNAIYFSALWRIFYRCTGIQTRIIT